MVNKKTNSNKLVKTEKYVFFLLLLSYITGICTGSFFVFSDDINMVFTQKVLSPNDFKVLLYFIMAFMLKYSGIASGLLIVLPFFLGIQNSADYSCNIITADLKKYEAALTTIKDTAVIMLLILYIMIIISQIINKKYAIKKDIKYFIVYFSGTTIILVLKNILEIILF